MNRPTVAYAMVVLNRLEEMKIAIRGVAPYVDATFVSDGGSTDGTIEWLSSDECKAMNVNFTVNKQVRLQYGDHTPSARQFYLDAAQGYDWIVVMDSDEWLEENGAKNLKNLAALGEARGIDGWAFNAHDITTYEDGQVYDNVSNYWNPSMFKSFPGQHYAGHTHSHIVRPGAPNIWGKSGFEYKHVKSERKMWHSSTFLWWTTAKNADNNTTDPEWLEFHDLMRAHGHLDWHELNKAMTAGNLPQDIKTWFIANKDHDNPERRAWFMHYFIFIHPEENVDKLSNRDREWDYVEKCRAKKNA